MIEVTLRVPESVRDKVSEIIAKELGKVERELKEVEGAIKHYESKYGLSSKEFAELWGRAEGGKCVEWPFPDDADMDLIEWKSLCDIRDALEEEREALRESLKALRI